jgi:hypothetical protein
MYKGEIWRKKKFVFFWSSYELEYIAQPVNNAGEGASAESDGHYAEYDKA